MTTIDTHRVNDQVYATPSTIGSVLPVPDAVISEDPEFTVVPYDGMPVESLKRLGDLAARSSEVLARVSSVGRTKNHDYRLPVSDVLSPLVGDSLGKPVTPAEVVTAMKRTTRMAGGNLTGTEHKAPKL
jgi:hypothetical protein